ncbi:hypothetical protein ACFVTZ_03900 [Cellulosimicrobium cellulans]|uniref:hypothetical protein n=1 Tax=Cellulosimicrobium cellulans TaxID=1710 RepID=UPI0036F14153
MIDEPILAKGPENHVIRELDALPDVGPLDALAAERCRGRPAHRPSLVRHTGRA